MDRYDALLEQLKLTQRHGLDEMANRLNTFVTELETLVETLKSSVHDAMPSSADDLFPIAQLESGLAELGAAAREKPRPSAGVSLGNLRLLDSARSQSELLRALLPLLCEHVGRAVVLVIRDGVVTAWSGMGFDNSEAIRSWSGGVAASPNFSKLVETGEPLMFDPERDPLVSGWLAGQGMAREGALLPISLRGKLMGIVYVDHDGDQPWALESAQALNATACLLIDTLHNRTVSPSPMLAEIAGLEIEAPAPPEPEIFETSDDTQPVLAEQGFGEPESSAFMPSLEPTPRPVAAPPTEAPSVEAPQSSPGREYAAQDDGEDEVEIDYDFEPAPASAGPSPAEGGFDPSATVRVEIAEQAPTTDFEPATPQSFPPPSPAPEAQPAVPRSVEEMEAPPPVRPIAPPVVETPVPEDRGVSAEDDARHEEARRFARLLVSEIKLYNEEEVDRGRVEKDLAVRLKEDIERSREMFEKRIAAEIRSGHDYFQEELVRILADGNADALGG